jgi:large subunit ribosomal protein L10
MAMNRAQKTELAKQVQEKFTRSQVAVFADYKGISATEADDLRSKVRGMNGDVQVIKNNIVRLAAKNGALGADAKEMLDGLVGPTLVAFAYGDAAAVAKAIHEFSKTNEALQIKESLMGQSRIAAKDIESLANLPSREQLLSTLLAQMNAPAQSFVGVLAAVPRSLVTVLSAIGKKKTNEV